MVRPACLTAMLLLGACAPDPAPPADPANREQPAANRAAPDPALTAPIEAASPVLAVDGEGLRWFDPISGAARPLPFGSARTAVLAAMSGRDPPETGTQEECGAGPLDYAIWSDGLKLYFQQDKLAGWALDGRAAGKVTTAAGIGPGSSRSELEAAYSVKIMQSTLGTEFAAGDLFGLLDGAGPRASVDAMWAGASCNFR